MDPSKIDELITIHLRYLPAARSLRILALAQQCLKVLYTEPSGSTVTAAQVAANVALMLGITRVPVDEISESLNHLGEHVVSVPEGYQLSDRGRDLVSTETARYQQRLESILDRHFPRNIPRQALRAWFRQVCLTYFERFGTYWASSVCRIPSVQSPPTGSWYELVETAAAGLGLEGHVKELSKGFASFKQGRETDDQDHLMGLGQAMFSARLLAARVGTDPITTDLLRDSEVLIDTNILVVESLDIGPSFESIRPLGNMLSQLNLTLRVLPTTLDEYERIIEAKRAHAIKAWAVFSTERLEESGDPFVTTAIARGCQTSDDLDRFFDDISQIPTSLNCEPIDLGGGDDLANAVEAGEADLELQKEIAEESILARRPRVKGLRALRHDAALNSVVERHDANDVRSWVLTTDRTMTDLSLRRVGPHGLPKWITLGTLIQVLAVDLSGEEVSAANFGALLAAMLRNDAQAVQHPFALEDLSWLVDIEERCANLTSEQLEKVSQLVSRARLSGKSSSDPDLHLEVQRAFQSERMDRVQEAVGHETELDRLNRDLTGEREAKDAALGSLADELTSKFHGKTLRKLTLKLVFGGIGSLLLVLGAVVLYLNASEGSPLITTFGLPTVFVAAALSILGRTLYSFILGIRRSRVLARSRADEEVQLIKVSGASPEA